MKKLIFAIGVMAVVGIASAAEAPAKGESQSSSPGDGGGTAFGCLFSPCAKVTICGPGLNDANKAADLLDKLEAPCQPQSNQGRDESGPPGHGRQQQ